MDWILLVRILITLTFLLLAVGGPVAIVQLRHFITLYYRRHGELQARVSAIERRLGMDEGPHGP